MATVVLVVEVLILLGLLAVGFLLRYYLPSYVREKGKNLATKEDIGEITRRIESVRADYSRSLEEVRAGLRVSAHERETRFAKLHERRATAIDGLYKRLVRAEDALQAMTGGVILSGSDSPEERRKKASEEANELIRFFFENRLYFDEDFVATFDELHRMIVRSWNTLVIYSSDDLRDMTKEERRESLKQRRKAIDAIRDRLPALRATLEDRMRRALAGDGLGPADTAAPAVAQLPDPERERDAVEPASPRASLTDAQS